MDGHIEMLTGCVFQGTKYRNRKLNKSSLPSVGTMFICLSDVASNQHAYCSCLDNCCIYNSPEFDMLESTPKRTRGVRQRGETTEINTKKETRSDRENNKNSTIHKTVKSENEAGEYSDNKAQSEKRQKQIANRCETDTRKKQTKTYR